MFKQTTIFVLLLALALTKYVVNNQPHFVGGYQLLDLRNANAIDDPETYREVQSIVDFAKTEYQKQNAQPLGRLVSVSRQVVAGYNYKLIFQNEGEQVQIVVFDQSWTQTRQVSNIQVLQKKQ